MSDLYFLFQLLVEPHRNSAICDWLRVSRTWTLKARQNVARATSQATHASLDELLAQPAPSNDA